MDFIKGLSGTLLSCLSHGIVGGCDSRLVEYVFVTLSLYECYLWLLDYAFIKNLVNDLSGCEP